MLRFVHNLFPPLSQLEAQYDLVNLGLHLTANLLQASATYSLFRDESFLRVPALLLQLIPAAFTGGYSSLRLDQFNVPNCLEVPKTDPYSIIVGFVTFFMGPLHPIVPYLLWGCVLWGREPYDAEKWSNADYDEDQRSDPTLDVSEWTWSHFNFRNAHLKGTPSYAIIQRLLRDATGCDHHNRGTDTTTSDKKEDDEDDDPYETAKKKHHGAPSRDLLRRLEVHLRQKRFVYTPQHATLLASSIPWMLLAAGGVVSGSWKDSDIGVKSIVATALYVLWRSVEAGRTFEWRALLANCSFLGCDLISFCFLCFHVGHYISWGSALNVFRGEAVFSILDGGTNSSGSASGVRAFLVAKLSLAGLSILAAAVALAATTFRAAGSTRATTVTETAVSFVFASFPGGLMQAMCSPLSLLVLVVDEWKPWGRHFAPARLLHHFLHFAPSSSSSSPSSSSSSSPSSLLRSVDWERARSLVSEQAQQRVRALLNANSSALDNGATTKLQQYQHAHAVVLNQLGHDATSPHYSLRGQFLRDAVFGAERIDGDEEDRRSKSDDRCRESSLLSPVVRKALDLVMLVALDSCTPRASASSQPQVRMSNDSPQLPSLATALLENSSSSNDEREGRRFFTRENLTIASLTTNSDLKSIVYSALLLRDGATEQKNLLMERDPVNLCFYAVASLTAISSVVNLAAVVWFLRATLLDNAATSGAAAPAANVAIAATSTVVPLAHQATLTLARNWSAGAACVSLGLAAFFWRDFTRQARTSSLFKTLTKVHHGFDAGISNSQSGVPVQLLATCIAMSHRGGNVHQRLIKACGAPECIPETALTQHVLAFLSSDHVDLSDERT